MKNGTKIRIHSGVPQTRLLQHYVLTNVEELRNQTADREHLEVDVEAIRDAKGAAYLVSVEMGGGAEPALVQEIGPDPFLAVRNAFEVARSCAQDHMQPAAW